jgi:hypothetical protein
MKHLLVAAAIAAITLLGVFVFPGHTWLQADTQIYLPMFERLWNPALYNNDLITSRPHLAFTIYDETALALRAITRLDFRYVLLIEQILFRALAVWGIYLIGRRFTESPAVALLTAAIVSLGATIAGPSVLSFEYEPVPRGFAVALLFCAIGLVIHGEIVWASVAASTAFLYHAPTTYPFWILFSIIVIRGRRWAALIPPLAAAVILAVLSRLQPGITEAQPLFSRIDPALEYLQRLRASYNWVSLWPRNLFAHYAILWLTGLAAVVRLRPKMNFTARVFFAGLPIIGLLSIPASYLLLERMKWSLMPQFQPARAILFVTVCAVLLCALAGAEASGARRYLEAFAWFLLPFLIPVHRLINTPYSLVQVLLICALAALAASAAAMRRWAAAGVAITVLAATFAIPSIGNVINYSNLHDAALDDLAAWARSSTPVNAVFLFPDAGKDLYPGIFRVESLRAVYVDWKTGGQVNYFKDLGVEWWSRWQQVMVRHELPPQVDYVVYKTVDAPPGLTTVFRNSAFACVSVR